MILFTLLGQLPTQATDISYPYVFANGQTLPASQLNGDFNAVTAVVNGGITNGNINASAGIALSKLALTATALDLMATGNPTWASGITGDTVPRIALTSNGTLGFGAGSASAQDIIIKRTNSTTLAIRNFADDTDENLTAAGGAFSGAVSGTTGTFSSYLQGTALKLVNTNTMTFTLAALAANRAITVYDPLASATLPFYTGSLVANGVMVTDTAGLNLVSLASAGTAGQVLKSNGASAAPSFGNQNNFGGTGSDGAVTGSGTDSAFKQYNATTYSVADGATHTVKSGTVINCTSTATIGGGASGTLTITQQMSGGAGAASNLSPAQSSGAGPGGAPAVTSNLLGGGGGGCGGAGGAGGANNAGTTRLPSGQAIYNSGGAFLIGSGGAGGGAESGVAAGGAGGAGGGRLVICAVGAITIASGATVSAVGSAGSAGASSNAAGGGGGSGGVIILASQASTAITGTATVAGGAGGNSAGNTGGGGGGGGGIIVQWSPSNAAAGTRTTTGGAAGTTTGSGTAASAGSSGVSVQVSGTPNLPLIGWLIEPGNIEKICSLPGRNLRNRDVAALAAQGDICKYFTYVSGSLTESCEAIGDVDNALLSGRS